jgi:MFS family permease
MLRRRKIFYGWWIVLVSIILTFFSGGTFFYGFTVFFNPIREGFGWTATVTSVAFVFRGLETGLMSPIAGFLVDRVGPRKLALCGWGIIGLGFLLMSRINSLWAFYGSFVIISTGLSFGAFVVLNAAVANWFTKKRSRALALVNVGMGASGLLVPLLALSVGQFGWRTSLFIIGIGLWVICLPLCLVMRHKPQQYGYLPDGDTATAIPGATNGSVLHSPNDVMKQDSGSSIVDFTAKEALRTRAFWLLSLAYFFTHIALSAVMAHVVPYLESVDIPSALAATVVTGMTLCSLIGRLGFGFLGDFTNKRYLVAIGLVLQTIGIFAFSCIDADRVWLIVPFLLAYAPGYGGPIPLRAALLADYFGGSSFGTIFGWVALVVMIGGLVGPVVAGWIFDVMGSYRLAWQLLALVIIPAIPLILLAKPPRVKQEA